MQTMKYIKALVFTGLILLNISVQAQVKSDYFTVENYYKVKWGYAEEFISLWKTNHYPLLKKAIEKGDIISVEAEKPRLHSGEDTRWDFRVIIVFKDAKAAFDENLTTPYKKQLYPDLDKLAKDEQHRFELLISHWDVMTEKINLANQ
ncbi:MAG TPA: EthD domain-containing protein [Chitinophagaceae bacterium]|nr:EthD domain-containing protein [Chitinophagaceae bacterium]